VVTSPLFAIIDLALPALLDAARIGVCIHVPGHYVTDPPFYRSERFQRLCLEQRLMLLFTSAVGPTGRSCAWIVVVKESTSLQRLIRPTVRWAPASFHTPTSP
jgi:hypothetical protein